MPLGTDGNLDRAIVITVDSTDDPIPILICYVEGEVYPRFVLLSSGVIRVGVGAAAPV